MKNKTNYLKLVLTFTCLITIINIQGQNHDDHETSVHGFKHFRAAISIGHGHIPIASNQEANFLVLPTWGLDFQYWFDKKWAIGFKGDLEIANYIIEDKNDGNHLEREKPLILTTPVFYSPWENNGWVFFLGPGVELEGDHNFFVIRSGVGYEIHLPKGWDIAPEFIYDIKGGYVNSFTLALGIGKRF